MGGMAEVEAGKVARQKAAGDAVRQYANRMVDDHTKANDELKGIAGGKGIDLPAAPDKAAQALLRLVEADDPPTRLFLGEDALGLVDQKLGQMKAEMTTWEALSRSTSFAG